jgi:hypothetical protein
MKRNWAFFGILAILLAVGLMGIADAQTWTPLTNAPPVSVGAMLLLTDGRVLVHEEPNCSGSGCVGNSYSNWYTLTPDITGSYINGTWAQVASLPSGYTPLFFASAVLPDGKVVIQGGEYNCPSGKCTADWQSNGAFYDPVANTWTSTVAPFPSGDEAMGDAQSVVLPNGTWMVAACCAQVSGYTAFPDYFYFNESSLNFTSEASSSDGETTEFDESGWNLLPNGDVLMVNVYLGAYNATAMGYALYNPSTNSWTEYSSTAEQLWDAGCGKSSKASYELGPVMLMPNGTLFATGASECEAGNIATYNWSTNTWTGQGTFPGKSAANDAPGATEINGNAIVVTSPYTGTFSTPLTIYEWNGTSLTTFPNVSRASSDSSYETHLLVLPTGQIMFTDFSTTVEILTSAGTYQSAWQPTITSAPTTLTPGSSYSISGTQFNGVTTGAAYGDDFQDNTNYPLVRIVNTASGNVYYARTHGHSTMGVATGSELVSTNFDVPATMPNGSCELYVVANGIPSAGAACTVGTSQTSTTSVSSSADPSTYAQSVSFGAVVSGTGGTPTGTVQFNIDGAAFGSPVTLSSGAATSGSTSALTAGTHTVTAVYSGDSNFSGSTGTLSGGQVVNQASQSITFTTNAPASAAYNSNFTVAASASSGLAVAFTSSGSCSNSGANYTMTSGTGSCSVIANQSGNSNYAAATQVTQTTSATPATQSITFTTNAPASAAYNSNFTVAASASSGLSVAFTSSGSCSNSGATYTMTSGTGSCSVIANQSGNSNYAAATQVTQTTSATPATQSITFTTNAPASAAYNSNFTVAASASSGLAVAFTSSGSCSNSGATYTMTSGSGSCSVIANQSGNSNYAAATQVTQTTSATPATQSITFTTNAPASAAYNSNFTVAASASSGLPVAFTSAGGCSNSGATYTMTSGSAACSIKANQSGNSNYTAATQVTQTTSATPAATSISVTSVSPASEAYGQNSTVTITALLSWTGSGAAPTAADVAIAGNGPGSYGTTSCSAPSGTTITCMNTYTPGSSDVPGSYTESASFTGDSNYSASSSTQSNNFTISQATSTTSVVANPNPSNYGQSVTLTATISGQYGQVKTHKNAKSLSGSVTWSSNTGCGTTSVNSGVATCSTSSLGVGTDSVTATYSGDSNHGASSGSTNQVVNQATTSISVTSVSPSSEDYGADSPVTITAVITWTGSGSAPTASDITIGGNGPSGYGSTSCGAASGNSITCTSTYTPTAADVAGSYTESASFSGDTNYSSSASTQSNNFTINNATSTTTVFSSANPSEIGQSVTFTATINGENGLVKGRKSVKRPGVTGSVTWSSNTGCGTTTVTSGNPGIATCSTSSLGQGTDMVTANYLGDSNHQASSGSINQVVSQLQGQTITFTTNAPSSAVYNTTFTVAATGGGSGNPVTFTSSGVCTNVGATYTMTSGTGSCSVIANQAGNSQYAAAPQVTETVNAALATQTISVSQPAPPTATDNSSFTVVASASSGLPVTYGASGVCANSGGTYTIDSTKGTCTETINAAGNSNYSAAAQVTESTTVAKAIVPTVSFTGAPATATYLSTFDVTATSNSFSVPTITAAGACTVSGTTVTMSKGTGTCTLTATWAANYVYAKATAKQTTTAELGASVTTITSSSPNPSLTNQKVTIDYTVAQANGNSNYATGTVTVNASTGETCKSSLSDGAGKCMITFKTAGTRTLTATYAGSTNNSGSVSSGYSQVVNP